MFVKFTRVVDFGRTDFVVEPVFPRKHFFFFLKTPLSVIVKPVLTLFPGMCACYSSLGHKFSRVIGGIDFYVLYFFRN